MLDTLTFITPMHLAMIPITVGVVGVFKNFSWFDSRVSPLVALIAGVILCALIGGPVTTVVIAGLVVGLSASGLYSGTASVKDAMIG